MDNWVSQMLDIPRAETANTETKPDPPSPGQRNTRQILRPLRGKAANCRGVAVFGEGKFKIPRGFVHFRWDGGDILT